ncbi:MAG: type II toxin-antitoxin system RelE/ParE family toxin [Planctomycetes bacterium]|nr:type II toxin-antitoxin system RelE/ParE family toxin [Planctomycetota bacterium]
MNRIVFHPEAELEFEAAWDYYELRRKGLGDEFALAVEAVLDRIRERPESCSAHGTRGFRMALAKRFPYTVYFRESAGRFWVMAIAHQRRRPNYWRSRRPS